ncbi:MAG: hypothetical protein ABIP51_04325 [Bacteroidia bacterium]
MPYCGIVGWWNQQELEKQKQRLQNARSLMLDGEIKPDDYKEMKNEIENKILELVETNANKRW